MRLGLADLETEQPGTSQAWEGDGDVGFALGGGLRATLYEADPVTWGAIVQFSWAEVEGDRKQGPNPPNPWGGDYKSSFELELTEWQIAAGATFQATEQVAIYGGPFVHLVGGHHSVHVVGSGGGWSDSSVRDIEQDAWFGGYAGVQVDFTENTSFDIEYLYTSDADAICGSFTWGF